MRCLLLATILRGDYCFYLSLQNKYRMSKELLGGNVRRMPALYCYFLINRLHYRLVQVSTLQSNPAIVVSTSVIFLLCLVGSFRHSLSWMLIFLFINLYLSSMLTIIFSFTYRLSRSIIIGIFFCSCLSCYDWR